MQPEKQISVIKQENGSIPQWLKPLLKVSFFSQCDTHHANKSECNMYCLNCIGEALCGHCCSAHHGHHLVQIRKASYQNVIRKSEISKYFDISDIQTYVINSATVVFLNQRPSKSSAANVCEICFRGLLDSFRFCSLGCKLVDMEGGDSRLEIGLLENARSQLSDKEGGDSSLVIGLNDKAGGETLMPSKRAKSSSLNQLLGKSTGISGSKNGNSIICDATNQMIDNPDKPFKKPKNRRKGIPRRSSFY